MRQWGCLLVLFCVGVLTPFARAQEPPLVEKYLHAGQLEAGEKALIGELAANPKNDRLRFGLGTLQFLHAVEGLGQSFYKYGLRSDRLENSTMLTWFNLPFVRMPVPVNPDPEEFSYDDARQILRDFQKRLERAEATLAEIKDEQVKLRLRMGLVRLNLTGKERGEELLVRVMARYFGPRADSLRLDPDLPVCFDRGDVAWMRGYCHLLLAMTNILLAYDGQELFDCSAHLFFRKVKTPHKFLQEHGRATYWEFDGIDIIDVIGLIHVVRMPVKEPERMKAALGHLEKTLALSRETWKYILAETDDDHEWLPNPRQSGALGIRVSQEMINTWLEFVDEAEAILQGMRLVPFWRGAATLSEDAPGVNLRRVFLEPRPFDLVLWLQGTAATPYLEKGPKTRKEVWERLQRVFRGDFIGFAIWFN
jgi:hypothetical protein